VHMYRKFCYMNFEEFGSDFEEEAWHDFRDKSVLNF
jgi:hypothetical protein